MGQILMGVEIHGMKKLKRRENGPPNAVDWSISEDPSKKMGIPGVMETAILLKRRSEERFSAILDVQADVSGFSFTRLQDKYFKSANDPIMLDPNARSVGPDEPELDGSALGSERTWSLVSGGLQMQRLLTAENAQKNESIVRQTIQEIEEFVDAPHDPGQEGSSDLQQDTIQESNIDSWLVDLTSMGSNPDEWMRILDMLKEEHLREYFPQLVETPVQPIPSLIP